MPERCEGTDTASPYGIPACSRRPGRAVYNGFATGPNLRWSFPPTYGAFPARSPSLPTLATADTGFAKKG
ncbi:hypothetical protein GCM10010532_068700 [Dactylosporangium siamense]